MKRGDAGPATAVVFDVGNVLIEWDPRRLYRKLLRDEQAVEAFLATVCTPAWNAQQDRGRGFRAGIDALVADHPEHADLIAVYWQRWPEMLGGAIGGTVRLLRQLQGAGVPCYGLTNFSAETWPLACRRFPLLRSLDGVVVSGREGVVKPERAIFRRLASRFGLEPTATVFVDDTAEHVAAARGLGFRAVRFTDPAHLCSAVRAQGLPV